VYPTGYTNVPGTNGPFVPTKGSGSGGQPSQTGFQSVPTGSESAPGYGPGGENPTATATYGAPGGGSGSGSGQSTTSTGSGAESTETEAVVTGAAVRIAGGFELVAAAAGIVAVLL
jgi:hypothetical protein